jgi:hypothetical protein
MSQNLRLQFALVGGLGEVITGEIRQGAGDLLSTPHMNGGP